MNPLQTSIASRTTKLPALLLREIGRITIAFAAIEHELNLVAYTLLNVSRAEGRLAVTRQNIRSRMALIKQLAEVKSANLSH